MGICYDLARGWFIFLLLGVILLNSVYVKGNYIKHFFDFNVLIESMKETKENLGFAHKFVGLFYCVISFIAYFCIYLGLFCINIKNICLLNFEKSRNFK